MEFTVAVYHPTSRGTARQKILFSHADRMLFLDTLTLVVVCYGWICHGWYLIANP